MYPNYTEDRKILGYEEKETKLGGSLILKILAVITIKLTELEKGKTFPPNPDPVIELNLKAKNLENVIFAKNEPEYPLNFPSRKHKMRQMRMRGNYSNKDHMFSFKNIQEFDPFLDVGRVKAKRSAKAKFNSRKKDRQNKYIAKKYDLKKIHKNFLQEMNDKNYNLDCSLEKFENLARNSRTKFITKKSIEEAKIILQSETENLIKNPRRPHLDGVKYNLDFVIDDDGPYNYVNLRRPSLGKKFLTSESTKTKKLMEKEILRKEAQKVSKNILLQDQQYEGNDVLYIIDLKKVPPQVKEKFAEELMGNFDDISNIKFINK